VRLGTKRKHKLQSVPCERRFGELVQKKFGLLDGPSSVRGLYLLLQQLAQRVGLHRNLRHGIVGPSELVKTAEQRLLVLRLLFYLAAKTPKLDIALVDLPLQAPIRRK